MTYSVNDIPDLTGQTWLVTGATSGVGLATARYAAARGARVILGVRNTRAGEVIAAQLPGTDLGGADVLPLDLSDLASVRDAAGKVDGIDVLVNNAGVSADSLTMSADGFELDLATNLLGPFLFTGLVLEKVRRRIVIVSSAVSVYKDSELHLEDPRFEHRPWKKMPAYGESKLAVMLWGAELSRRLSLRARAGSSGAGDGVPDVQLTYPGWAATSISNPTPWKFLDAPMRALTRLMGQSAEQGALCSMYAATADLPAGSYIGPDGSSNLKGSPTVLQPSANAWDLSRAAEVWEFAETATSPDTSQRTPDTSQKAPDTSQKD